MTIIENNIYSNNEYSEIEIIHPDYRCIVKIDNEDLKLISKVSLTNSGYAKTQKELLHRLIMGCVKGDNLQVDHINGDKLDNRKHNLRVVTDSINKRNQHSFSRNNTGTIGIQQRSNGAYQYYRVSWRDNEGKRFCRQFNINVLGDDIAFEEAKKCLLKNQELYGYM